MSLSPAIQDMVSRIRAETGLPLDVSISSTGRSLRMRVDHRSGRLKVTMPAWSAPRSVETFIRGNMRWAQIHAQAAAERTRLLPGAQIPFMGVMHAIRQDMSKRFPARLENGPGAPEILVGSTGVPEAHVMALLRREALARMKVLTEDKAGKIARNIRSVTIKDTSSRWGSCSSRGEICYSWRIILAPPEMSDYLAAHEVAHLEEMNHSWRFWKICDSLSDWNHVRARSWLGSHGKELMRYGPPG